MMVYSICLGNQLFGTVRYLLNQFKLLSIAWGFGGQMKKSVKEEYQELHSYLVQCIKNASFSFNCKPYEGFKFGEQLSFTVHPLETKRYVLTVYHSGRDEDHYETLVMEEINQAGLGRKEVFRLHPLSKGEEFAFTMPFYSRTLRGSPEGCASIILRLGGISDGNF